MKKCTYRGLLAILSFLLICSCGEVREYVNMAQDRNLSQPYYDALATWTREKTLHSQFETRIHVYATQQSAEFRKAYILEYARHHDLNAAAIKMREDAAGSVAADFLEFNIFAYTPDKEDNDFDRPRSMWTVFLIDGEGRKIEPLEIRQVEKITNVTQAFYPYIKPYYGVFYSVKFPPPASDRLSPRKHLPLKLVLTSVRGRVELTW